MYNNLFNLIIWLGHVKRMEVGAMEKNDGRKTVYGKKKRKTLFEMVG